MERILLFFFTGPPFSVPNSTSQLYLSTDITHKYIYMHRNNNTYIPLAFYVFKTLSHKSVNFTATSIMY